MTREEAFKLTPEISYVIFAKGKYRVAYVAEEFGVTWIGIYDEPPSLHTDRIQAGHCELSLPPAEGTEQRIRVRNILQDFYRRGEYELEQAEEDIMRLFQQQPTAEGAEEITAKAILKKNMSVKYCGETRYAFLDDDEIPLILKAMQEFASIQRPTTSDVAVKHLTDEEIEKHGMEGGLRDGELQMFWEGATFYRSHAQRIADKMVSERLREELIRYIKWYGGFNYEDMTDEMLVNEYLKSREDDKRRINSLR